MSEDNGKREMKNRDIWEAFQGLQILGGEKLPGTLAWRVALNQNHMRRAYDDINAARERLVIDMKVSPEYNTDADYPERMKAFRSAWLEVLQAPCTWETPAKIEARSLSALKDFNANAVATLVIAGVIVNPDEFPAG